MNARRRRLAAHLTGVEIAPAADDITLLLPWYVAGTLDDRNAHRVDAAIRGNAALASQVAEIAGECVEIVALNGEPSGPSPRALHRLFAAIDEVEGRPALVAGSSIQLLHPELAHGQVQRRASHAVVKKIGCCV